MEKLKIYKTGILILLFAIFFSAILPGQSSAKVETEFVNAPVLFRENGRSYQQIVANCDADAKGKIIIVLDSKEVVKSELRKGMNKFLITIPAVTKSKNISLSVKVDDGKATPYSINVVPPKKWEIYLVQHSHTDIGYTRPQSEILAEQMRYIDYALDYCDQTDDLPEEAKFRWTCESSWVTREYLRSRPKTQIERFLKRIAEGRIEVAGMYANMAEIADENVMYDFLQPLKEFDKLNIPVRLAMQNDVNGIAWCMPDYFKHTGVKYLIMGINETRSVLPFDKPTCFWWESPSGARLLAFRADHYMTGNFFGIESDAIKPENLLGHLADLDKKGYPFDKIGIQFSGYFTDNAPPSTVASRHVIEWNKKYEYPKLRLAVASEFPEFVEKNYSDKLPVYKNAWLDWWTDGYGSTSRETAESRKAKNIKQVDEGLFAMVSVMGGELNPSLEVNLDHINENIIFFDEHTCGADESVSHPYSENSTKQWLQKGAYAWEAMKKVTLLNEEAMARFQPYLKKADFPVIYVMNPVGWERSGHVNLFIDYEVLPVKTGAKIIDLETGNEVPAQIVTKRREGAYWVLEVNNVPALGYKALKIELTGYNAKEEEEGGSEVLENSFYRLEIDRSTGAVGSLLDKELNLELIDKQSIYKIGQPVRETSEKRDKPPFLHSTCTNIKIEKGIKGSVWESIFIKYDLGGFEKGREGEPVGIEAEIRLYKNTKKIEFRYMARKLIITDPEASYVAFPFSMPGSRIVFETIGGILSQGQQLPGSATDWNVAQNFVAVRGQGGQIVVVSNEVPLWHFSDFNMGKFDRNPKAGKPWLYSWVMNNYWFTNFRAYQEGAFSWSYQITSSSDTTNSFATKYAWSQRNHYPTRTFPAGKNEFDKPTLETLKINAPENVLLANIRPSFTNPGAILLRFRELEGKEGEVMLSSAVPGRSVNKITEVNAAGKHLGQPMESISLKPFEVKFIEVEF
ncbi:MAG TPA: glycoside hydrolase family 38 C-terminal domain-containing protein [Bacteroidales bacterium]|nr:glycoside hydrolase family 38 C-terminal domain-containing protein [Bacteroidales bacterium]